MHRIALKAGHDRRARAGHPWIFSNEIQEESFKTCAPGEPVEVEDAQGRFLGRGYFNPHSLIAIRLLTRQPEEIDADFFRHRILEAWRYRQRIYPGQTALRLIYSESDGLPGLIVDRYGDCLSVQLLTLGMEQQREPILSALAEIVHPRAIVLRNDAPIRRLEGLALEKGVAAGTLEGPVTLEEGGVSLGVDLLEGQKTGFFFDQRENRLRMRRYVAGARILDGFCYTGAWALQALQGGAAEVVGIDASARALAWAEENGRRNGRSARCRFQRADLFEALKVRVEAGERFDGVILDPPALAESRKSLPTALKGYEKINFYAMRLLGAEGFLFTCSCSYHLTREMFVGVIVRAARKARKSVRIMEYGQQAPDHPILPTVPETEYLKCLFLEVKDER
ncbi:MAG: class I SAM-dependent rRNA methyltransferase [Candidatus Tectomicrobia bacterium]|uniref:Class I SAM-dependent rRNA methyltransferase n=1 Tax=Tectimicrobiota bacterium TaxID=2528274 RepID=A0A932G0N6_UNCTE|nr:class I SAM-dependent rRNA methyltransferase [Candidatus Tectomicrobia bacterium]